MSILELYPEKRIRSQTLIPVWKDTRDVLNMLKKYLNNYNPEDRIQSYDDLILILMDFALYKEQSSFYKEIYYITENIKKEKVIKNAR